MLLEALGLPQYCVEVSALIVASVSSESALTSGCLHSTGTHVVLPTCESKDPSHCWCLTRVVAIAQLQIQSALNLAILSRQLLHNRRYRALNPDILSRQLSHNQRYRALNPDILSRTTGDTSAIAQLEIQSVESYHFIVSAITIGDTERWILLCQLSHNRRYRALNPAILSHHMIKRQDSTLCISGCARCKFFSRAASRHCSSALFDYCYQYSSYEGLT